MPLVFPIGPTTTFVVLANTLGGLSGLTGVGLLLSSPAPACEAPTLRVSQPVLIECKVEHWSWHLALSGIRQRGQGAKGRNRQRGLGAEQS